MPEKYFLLRRKPVFRGPAVLLLLSVLTAATPALAHLALIFAYAEGDTIHTESAFVPDTPVRQGKILVMDKKTEKVLLTGQTDDRGKFSFKIPAEAAAQKMDLEIVLEAAMGHRAEWLLKADSYLSGAGAGKTAPPAGAASPSPAAAPETKAGDPERQRFEEALNQALERQLAPLREKLTELSIRRTSLPDIIGGIGYILGLFGLWAYFQSKRIKNP